MATIKNILSIRHEISSDESDALAVACCHAWTCISESKQASKSSLPEHNQ
jgi:Holliday junction resolvasome RuvABC endonuclease subunit